VTVLLAQNVVGYIFPS